MTRLEELKAKYSGEVPVYSNLPPDPYPWLCRCVFDCDARSSYKEDDDWVFSPRGEHYSTSPFDYEGEGL